jgi:dipeptidyl aminopeptidase/acylaminoacyl peptidase
MLAAFKEKNVECELVVVEGAAHGFVGNDARYAAEARLEWFEKHLRSK